jgi:hypothetical protein
MLVSNSTNESIVREVVSRSLIDCISSLIVSFAPPILDLVFSTFSFKSSKNFLTPSSCFLSSGINLPSKTPEAIE